MGTQRCSSVAAQWFAVLRPWSRMSAAAALRYKPLPLSAILTALWTVPAAEGGMRGYPALYKVHVAHCPASI